jgi:hypothetical protein
LRLAGAIVLEALGFIVWNVGTRSPLGLLRDVGSAFRDVRKLFAGVICAIVGFIFISAATVLMLPVLALPDVDFLPAEILTLLVALTVEHLVGSDVRALANPRAE